ncbi:GAP family protein [Herbiconiux sp. 11R-BC]|uniref:GAP family protein n=1 Tax=Herbiconiux sp. 11R-BC TaxID=3111637 RepID=UPI003C0E2469
MAGIIGHILPLAVGVALSSVPIVVMVLILLSPRGRASSITYLIGAAAGMLALTLLFTAGASLLPPPPPSEKSPLFAVIEITLGVGLLVLAGVRWRRSRQPRARDEVLATEDIPADIDLAALAAAPASPARTTPKWMTRVTTLGPVPSLGVGFVLMLRPKNLLLTIAAGVAIGAGNPTLSEAAIAIVIYVVLGISTLAAPIIVAVANPTRMRKPLEETRIWIEGNSATVTTVVVLMLGTVIIGSGLQHF